MKKTKAYLTSNVVGVLVLGGILLYGMGCGSEQQKQPDLASVEAEVRIYEVFGMNCPGCHGGVEKLLNKLPAVQDSQANWQKKQVTITVRPGQQLSDDDVFDAVRRANFTPGKRLK